MKRQGTAPDRPDDRLRRGGPGATTDQIDPGAAAARARVEDLLEQIARVELQVLVVAPPDATRLAARERARTAAIVAGRGVLLEDATAATREATIRSFARGGYSGTWAATDMAVSVMRASDRVAAADALEEAATAAIVEDLVDDDTLDVLRATWDELVTMTGMPSPGSLSAFALPAADALRGPPQVAIAVGSLVVCAAIWLTAGPGAGLVALALGLVVVGGSARRKRRSDP